MKTRMLGALSVSKIGFGTMSFASTYGETPAMMRRSASSGVHMSAA